MNFDHMMRLRLVVGRLGEMDNARWWNTDRLLGPLGGPALRRGFPKTHHFAQARAVFAAAGARCTLIYNAPGCVTLWTLPASVEDQFESHWAGWVDDHEAWSPFFEKLQAVTGTDLLAALLDLEAITPEEADLARKLRRAADNRAVPLPATRTLSNETLALLAAGFFRGEPGQPAVPYVRVDDV